MIGRLIALVVPWRFDASASQGLEATLELRVRARGRVSAVAISIADGTCTARPGAAPGASATALVSLADLIRLIVGDAVWPQLLSQGRFAMTGDPFVALRLPSVFGFSAGGRGHFSAGARGHFSAGARGH